VQLDDLPSWVPSWCEEHLGCEPVEVLFTVHQMSSVLGLRLAGGAEVVVKTREYDGRAGACVAAQAQLAERGFPCARPLTGAVVVGSVVAHAEELLPDGEVHEGDSPDVAGHYGEVFARLMSALVDVTAVPPLPNPRWVRWDHHDQGPWPAIEFLDVRDQRLVPAFVVEIAERVRSRLLGADLPPVLGYADFEAQNLRWNDEQLCAVYDWDSLAWQPESALVGAASGAFPRPPGQPPSLAPIESSEAFLAAYQQSRQRWFNMEELEVAWAASLWPAAHNARWDALLGSGKGLSADALRIQAADRLLRANA
jgi:hypothetical protein